MTDAAPQIDGVAELGQLPPGTVLYSGDLERMFDRSSRSIKRAVKRGDLPAPARLFGKSAWTVRAILNHIEARMDVEGAKVQKRQKQKREKIRQLSPTGGHSGRRS